MKVRTFGLKGFALLALSTFAFAACDDKTVIEPTPDPVEVSVTPSTLSLTVGQTGPLVAIVSNATNQAVTWTTSTPSVATVSATGVVTAVAPGTAVITAASVQDPNARAAAAVVVTSPPSNVQLQVVPPTAGVQVGGTVQLVSVVTGTTNTAVTYRSSAPGVATVSATGLVTGVSAGTAVITALATADTINGRGTSVITVTTVPPPVVSIALTPTTASVGVGGTQQFVATVTGSTNTGVTWRTSDPSIATISATGLATGVGQGTAIITAIANADTTKRQQATLTVVGASVAISSVPASPATGNFVIVTNVQVPAGTADSLVIRLTSGTTTYQVRCQTFTAAGAATTVNCPINPADIDPNTPGAQILPNGTYTIQAVLLRQNQVAATATFGQQLTTQNNTTVAGVVTFDNSTVDNDNAADANQDVDPAGAVWWGGSATVTVTPSIFSGNAISTARVNVDVACDGVVDAFRSVTITSGTGSVTFPETATLGASNPGIDNVSNPAVCFTLSNAVDAGGAAVSLPATGGGTGNLIVGAANAAGQGTGPGGALNTTVGPAQQSFSIDNVEPNAAGAAMTFDGADFDGLTTGLYLGQNSNVTTTATNQTVLNVCDTPTCAAGSDPMGVDRMTVTYYAVPAASFDGTSQTTLRASAAAGTAFTSPTQLAEAASGTAYVLVVEVRDALGNRFYKGNAASASFGVDLTPPTIEVVAAASAPADAINPATMNVQFAVTDAIAGAEGVRGTTQGRSVFELDGDTGEELRCYSVVGANVGTISSGTACATQTQTTLAGTINVTTELYNVAIPADENFYTLSYQAFDAAGNTSTVTIERRALRDLTAGPDAVAALPVVSINSYTIDNVANTATVNGTVRDNIEVRAYDARFLFAGLAASNGDVPDAVPFTAPVAVGDYGLPLTGAAAVSATTQVNVDAIRNAPAGADVVSSQFGFGMTDVAGNFAFGGVAIPAGTSNGFTGTLTAFDLLTQNATIDRTPGAGEFGSTTLTARATTGPADANPFTGGQVYFYWVNPGGDFAYGTADDSNVLLAVVPAGTTAIQTGETARTYSWTTTLTATNLPVLPVGFPLQTFAVGVASDGDAIMTPITTVTVNQ